MNWTHLAIYGIAIVLAWSGLFSLMSNYRAARLAELVDAEVTKRESEKKAAEAALAAEKEAQERAARRPKAA